MTAEQLLNSNWRVSSKGALYINVRNHNLAVWEEDSAPGEWVWRLTPKGTTDHLYSSAKYDSELAAKRAVVDEYLKLTEYGNME